jgi:hypothetical protein
MTWRMTEVVKGCRFIQYSRVYTVANRHITPSFTSVVSGIADPCSRAIQEHSVNNVPSQVRTLIVLEVPSSVDAIFGRFCSFLGDFSVCMLPEHTQFTVSWIGAEHYSKSALVQTGPFLEHP